MSEPQSTSFSRFRLILIILFSIGISLGFLLFPDSPISLNHSTPLNAIYQQRPFPSGDGIGKVYQGREISKVMGHEGAAWLERSSREWEERPQQVVDALELKPDAVVADLGAGTGYFSFRIAPLVPEGKVLAVDVQPEMLDIVRFLSKEEGIDNVEPVLASVQDPCLEPEQVDLALMVDAYHEFEFPYEVMTAVVKALKPSGRAVLVEYRGENPFLSIKPHHKMTEQQAKREMAAVGLDWVKTEEFLPQQHFMVFQKPA